MVDTKGMQLGKYSVHESCHLCAESSKYSVYVLDKYSVYVFDRFE